MKRLFFLVVLILIGVSIYYSHQPLEGIIGVAYKPHAVSNDSVHFISDIASENASTTLPIEEILSMVNEAEKYILVDIYFFNQYQIGNEGNSYEESLSQKLENALIEKKKQNPEINIILVTDSLNTISNTATATPFQRLIDAEIQIVTTNMDILRDNNLLYSPLWRSVIQWTKPLTNSMTLPNPLESDTKKILATSYFNYLNHKANHRKLIITDLPTPQGRKIKTLVTSVDAYDGNEVRANTALVIDGYIWRDVIESEKALPKNEVLEIPEYTETVFDNKGDVYVQLLTESAIKERLIGLLNVTNSNDFIKIATVYLSDTEVREALARAAHRGVSTRIILDSNTLSTFGKDRSGIPNQVFANDLLKKVEDNLQIKWCTITGFQCHANIILISHGVDEYMMVGSHHLTRRSLSDFNMNTSILVSGNASTTAIIDGYNYFNSIWKNEGEIVTSSLYETDLSENKIKKMYAIFAEITGISFY